MADTEYRYLFEQTHYLKAGNAGPDIGGSGDAFGAHIAISADGTTLAVGAYGEDGSTTEVNGPDDDFRPGSGAVYVFVREGDGWRQEAYLKAQNAAERDGFGGALALSYDGSTLVVGAPYEASTGSGIDMPDDNEAAESGAAYIFERTDGSWRQRAYIKASNSEAFDLFGTAVAISGDGLTVAVGAHGEDSAGTGVNPPAELDNTMRDAGAVYIFEYRSSRWWQMAYVKAHNPGIVHFFGISLALSQDGRTLAVGADHENTSKPGVDPAPDNAALESGAAYVFTRSGATWQQDAFLKASNVGAGDRFGSDVALASDGSRLAVAADQEDSNGADGPQDNTAEGAGAAFVFARTDAGWTEEAYVKAINAESGDLFGTELAISGDGSLLAVSAIGEQGAGTGSYADPSDNSSLLAGAVYLYSRVDRSWNRYGYLKASNTAAADTFGSGLAVSADGTTLAAGAPGEDSHAQGVGGDQHDRDGMAVDSGAVYLFR